MLIFNIFFPVITGSNHGVGECDHIIKRTNDCQRLHPRCHLDQASFSPPPCHLDQALARGALELRSLGSSKKSLEMRPKAQAAKAAEIPRLRSG